MYEASYVLALTVILGGINPSSTVPRGSTQVGQSTQSQLSPGALGWSPPGVQDVCEQDAAPPLRGGYPLLGLQHAVPQWALPCQARQNLV